MMNGYKFTLYQAVYRDGKFSHNAIKHKTVHAKTKGGAYAQATAELDPSAETVFDGDRVLRAEEQYIKGCQYLGCVSYRTVVVYSFQESERQIPEQAALNLAIVAMMRAWRGQRYFGEAQRLASLQLCICDIVRGERNSDVEWWDDRITARR